MLPEPQRPDAALFDSDPVYNDLATVFAADASRDARASTRALLLAPTPPRARGSRGAVATAFALAAMLAGLGGLAASRYVVTPARPAALRPASATPAPRLVPASKPTATPAATPVVRAPVARTILPPVPIQLALSRPPSLPPIARRQRQPATAIDVEPSVPVMASRWQKTPHLTGAALTRALAQDVIDTRKLNMGVLRTIPTPRQTAATAERPR